jgi:tripartite-type tricarboxylate transporter receptor subunit TctC
MCAAGILADDAGAQTYPNRPIRCIIPYVAGSSPDVVGRIVGPRIAERLGQPLVLDNG